MEAFLLYFSSGGFSFSVENVFPKQLEAWDLRVVRDDLIDRVSL
jgi:hypothetical protein